MSKQDKLNFELSYILLISMETFGFFFFFLLLLFQTRLKTKI